MRSKYLLILVSAYSFLLKTPKGKVGGMQNNIGAARRSFAKRAGIKYTQAMAAKDLNVSLSAYRNWEQGRNLPNANAIVRMAQKYECSVDYLIGDAEPGPLRLDTVDGLTRDERELLTLYQSCTTEAKAAILASTRGIANSYQEIESTMKTTTWYHVAI